MPSREPPAHLRGVTLPAGADVEALRRRYGTDRSRAGVLVVIALVAIPFLGWVVWAGLQQAHQEIRWQTVGFSDATDESVSINFEVVMSPGSSAECTVRALDVQGVEVGRAQVPVTGQDDTTRVDYDLAVTARPSSAFVDSCRLAE